MIKVISPNLKIVFFQLKFLLFLQEEIWRLMIEFFPQSILHFLVVPGDILISLNLHLLVQVIHFVDSVQLPDLDLVFLLDGLELVLGFLPLQFTDFLVFFDLVDFHEVSLE